MFYGIHIPPLSVLSMADGWLMWQKAQKKKVENNNGYASAAVGFFFVC